MAGENYYGISSFLFTTQDTRAYDIYQANALSNSCYKWGSNLARGASSLHTHKYVYVDTCVNHTWFDDFKETRTLSIYSWKDMTHAVVKHALSIFQTLS